MRLMQSQTETEVRSPAKPSSPSPPITTKSPKTPQASTPITTSTPGAATVAPDKQEVKEVTPLSKKATEVTPLSKKTTPKVPTPKEKVQGQKNGSVDKNKRLSCGNSGCNFRTMSSLKMAEHRKLQGHLTPKKKAIKSPNSSLTIQYCNVGDCEFYTRYQSNLMRHRRRRNHFSSEEDRIKAKAEANRDEIFREIEQKPVDSAEESSESSDELDVTIPLVKHTSPSKITDYFKPVNRKPVKKVLDLNETPQSETKKSSNTAKNSEVELNSSFQKTPNVLEQ